MALNSSQLHTFCIFLVNIQTRRRWRCCHLRHQIGHWSTWQTRSRRNIWWRFWPLGITKRWQNSHCCCGNLLLRIFPLVLGFLSHYMKHQKSRTLLAPMNVSKQNTINKTGHVVEKDPLIHNHQCALGTSVNSQIQKEELSPFGAVIRQVWWSFCILFCMKWGGIIETSTLAMVKIANYPN